MSEQLEDGIIDIHGKQYHTVARRLKDFWEKHPDWSITTKVVDRSKLLVIRATIKDSDGRVRATGTAEEERDKGNINRTSALENCETSAIGRALGVYGMGGTAIASAEEMERALEQQKEASMTHRLLEHNLNLAEHFYSVVVVKEHLLNEDYSAAYEALAEIPENDRKALWIAPTKGGIWTSKEREQIKSNEMAQARKTYHGEVA